MTTPIHAASSLTTLAQPEGWRKWWLPANYAEHGAGVDLLFTVIFWVTVGVGTIVLLLLLKYCIQFRHREDRKAHFTHGNKKLEITWTIIPAILLVGLAVWTKGSWDEFRYGNQAKKDSAAKILVIAEQFKWNSIYPGPDGKLGRYLQFPKTTDAKWPALPPDNQTFFADTYAGLVKDKTLPPGPAYLPPDMALKLINGYVDINKLGKDFSDPNGVDDDWQNALSRTIVVPKGRLVEIELTSKDVIHDFFVPEFRVKLDAVPGMRGKLYFTPTVTSASFEQASVAEYTLDELTAKAKEKAEYRVIVAPDEIEKYSKVEMIQKTKPGPRGPGGKPTRVPDGDPEQVKSQLITNGQTLGLGVVESLRELGLTKAKVYRRKTWDVVCEELCGNGHYSMQGAVMVVEGDEYARRFEGKGATESE